jgi:H+/gluconate symporter-like permease
LKEETKGSRLYYSFSLECRPDPQVLAPIFHIFNKKSSKGGFMKETRLILPELGLIAGTRVALGGGVALLLAEKLNKEQRKAVGWTLFLVGAITTIPLVIMAFARRR